MSSVAVTNRQVLLVNDTGMLKLIMLGRTDWGRAVQERAKRTPDHLKTQPWPTELFVDQIPE